jgi:hypothetical protein
LIDQRGDYPSFFYAFHQPLYRAAIGSPYSLYPITLTHLSEDMLPRWIASFSADSRKRDTSVNHVGGEKVPIPRVASERDDRSFSGDPLLDFSP